ncbi:hypothetical protein [Pedobacter sp.]|jgi:hypothetical protein|uniref:hypothetical protein n=1 Tax=Pedobacter sp. TaxID=1411316 RepID=UPI002D0CFB8D|nr:hypothetical protein [Pedobacter sp.]HEV3222385.1 hypothetical protein [Puia sp.]HWW39250.1 hypothetical protein [Pedobacter sp.]
MRLLKMMLVLITVIALMSCRHKNANGGETRKIEPEDFRAMFRNLNLPVNFGDSSLAKKPTDSVMSWSVYHQFIADSLIQKYFGKSAKPRLYATGKLVVKNAETYLVIKALSPSKKILYVVCLDKEGNFKTGIPLIIREDDSEFRYAANIDNKYTISVSRLRKDAEGRSFFVRTVYVYNEEGVFTLIMRESNEGKPKIAQIYNPIDTLLHKHKYSGDYIQDKRNFISFRDGKNNSFLRFFVHFEKDNGNCKGELKGEARFVSSTVARYIANGDPCSLEFNFNEKSVRMKELEGCGNHRDIRCYFDGVYNKHKEKSVKQVKSKRR